MGPLVPDIIGNDLNLILALVIGVFFGMILEQAGFSTSKKLVGLFYGYDFTVLRVFFTAGIVAMIGVMILEHYGLLDINLIYINPTYVWSAVIGGLIMGLGFVIGGFCPGTSVCAAAIGKIDAMIFIGGSLAGVLVFAEGYPLFEGLYQSSFLGNPRLFETLGVSQNSFAFVMAVVALAAFWLVSIVENRVNGISKKAIRLTPYYVGLTSIGVIVALSAFMFPERKTILERMAEDPDFINRHEIKAMSVDEFAYRLMDPDNKMQVIDFRTPEAYLKFNLPKSTLFSVDNLFEKEPNKVLSVRRKINVIVADDELTEKKLAVLANELGYDRMVILEGGLNGFKENILGFKQPHEPRNKQEADTFRFRTKASKEIPLLIQHNQSAGPVKKTQKRVVGGC